MTRKSKWKISAIFAGILMVSFTAFAVNPVSLSIGDNWGTGMNGKITVTNTTQKTYDSWQVEFDSTFAISSIWNAKIKSQSGNHYVIESLSWNGKLLPGQSTSFGFGGKPGTAVPEITNIKINGSSISEQPETFPVANSDFATVNENSSILIGVLGNDTGDNLTIDSVSQPVHGTAVVENGKINYTPSVDYAGADSFNYTVKNSNGKTATAEITVKVNQIKDESYTINASVTGSGDGGTCSEYVQPDGGHDAYSLGDKILFQGKSYESLINNNVWTPTIYPQGWKEITEGAGGNANGTICPEGNVSINDGDSQSFSIKPNSGYSIKDVKVDGESVGTESEYTFNNVNSNHTISVEFKSESATAKPVANGDSLTAEYNAPATVNLTANDSGDNIKIQSVTKPAHGTVTNSDSSATYTPDSDYSGNDSFNYTIVDANGKTATAAVNVVVKETDIPITVEDNVVVIKNSAKKIDVLSNDTGDSLTIDSITQPEHGTAIIKDNKILYTPNSDYTGLDSFEYTAKNALGLTSAGTVALTIRNQVTTGKINATYWSIWGGNTSYDVGGKKAVSNAVEMDKIDPSYNVIIAAFIITDSEGNYTLAFKDPGSSEPAAFTTKQVKSFIKKTKAQGRKVIVSIGGQYFHLNVTNEEQKNIFAEQVEKIVDEYGFEGIDIDFEKSVFSGDSSPQLTAQAVKEVVNHYRSQGKDFWLTAAPEWPYITPYSYGGLENKWFKEFIEDVNIDNFNYIFVQAYNQNSNGVLPINSSYPTSGYNRVNPVVGMENFLPALVWNLTTEDGNNKNNNQGILIPSDKLVIGIPATEGAAGSHEGATDNADKGMAYTMTPEMINHAVENLEKYNLGYAGFMSWAADWDALQINKGDLGADYSHTSWETGIAIAKALNGAITEIPSEGISVSFNTPANGAVFEQETLSPIVINVAVSDKEGTVKKTEISVDGKTFEGTSANWTPSDFGNYTVIAKSIGVNGGETTKSISITVLNAADSGSVSTKENISPEIAFTTPYNNEIINQKILSPVHIFVSANDSDGTVESVTIEIDGQTFYGSTAEWSPSDFGTYTITAKATDDQGAVSKSYATVCVINAALDNNFIIGGYWENWKGAVNAESTNVNEAEYYKNDINNFSHIYYSFLTLAAAPEPSNPPGKQWNGLHIYESMTRQDVLSVMKATTSSDTGNWQYKKINALIKSAHQKGRKFIWAIGGWSDLTQTISDEQIPAFVNQCVELLKLAGDGIDFDWEHLSTTDSSIVYQQRRVLGKIFPELRKALDDAGMPEKLIGYTTRFNAFWIDGSRPEGVTAFPSDGEGIDVVNAINESGTSVDDCLDWINIMMYDVPPQDLGAADGKLKLGHYQQVLDAFAKYIPLEKIVMGFEPGGQAAGGIWEGMEIDREVIDYMILQNYGGVMFWAINQTPYNSQEHTGENSQVLAGYAKINSTDTVQL